MRLFFVAALLWSSAAYATETTVLRSACLEKGGTQVACACGQDLADQMLEMDVQKVLAVFILKKKPPLEDLKQSNVSVSDLIMAAEKWNSAVAAQCRPH